MIQGTTPTVRVKGNPYWIENASLIFVSFVDSVNNKKIFTNPTFDLKEHAFLCKFSQEETNNFKGNLTVEVQYTFNDGSVAKTYNGNIVVTSSQYTSPSNASGGVDESIDAHLTIQDEVILVSKENSLILVVQNLSEIKSPAKDNIYYESQTNCLYIYNGTTFEKITDNVLDAPRNDKSYVRNNNQWIENTAISTKETTEVDFWQGYQAGELEDGLYKFIGEEYTLNNYLHSTSGGDPNNTLFAGYVDPYTDTRPCAETGNYLCMLVRQHPYTTDGKVLIIDRETGNILRAISNNTYDPDADMYRVYVDEPKSITTTIASSNGILYTSDIGNTVHKIIIDEAIENNDTNMQIITLDTSYTSNYTTNIRGINNYSLSPAFNISNDFITNNGIFAVITYNGTFEVHFISNDGTATKIYNQTAKSSFEILNMFKVDKINNRLYYYDIYAGKVLIFNSYVESSITEIDISSGQSSQTYLTHENVKMAISQNKLLIISPIYINSNYNITMFIIDLNTFEILKNDVVYNQVYRIKSIAFNLVEHQNKILTTLKFTPSTSADIDMLCIINIDMLNNSVQTYELSTNTEIKWVPNITSDNKFIIPVIEENDRLSTIVYDVVSNNVQIKKSDFLTISNDYYCSSLFANNYYYVFSYTNGDDGYLKIDDKGNIVLKQSLDKKSGSTGIFIEKDNHAVLVPNTISAKAKVLHYIHTSDDVIGHKEVGYIVPINLSNDRNKKDIFIDDVPKALTALSKTVSALVSNNEIIIRN